MMAMNVELETNDDFERQNEKKMVALNTKMKWDGDFEHQNWKWGDGSKRQAVMRWWLWTLNWEKIVALNAKTERRWWL